MKREAIGADWSKPELLESINTHTYGEVSPTVSPDGKELFYSTSTPPSSIIPGKDYILDIWWSKRVSIDDEWEEPKNLGKTVNSEYRDNCPVLLGGGLLLFFYSDRPGYGQRDLYVTKRKSMEDEWCQPVNLGPLINSIGYENGVYMSGSSIFFNSTRPGGYGGQDIWEVQILNPESD